jgi:nicotinic acid mononucleotide adenylyltransferase
MKKVVIAFGRLNPPTIGHEKLVAKIKSEARKNRATPMLFLSHSQDKKKNPLSYEDKIRLSKKAFGAMVQKTTARTIIEVAKQLEKQYDELIVIGGSDRVQEFQTLLDKYNGKDYAYEKITVVSAGERDPDSDDVSGMSASKLRSLAQTGKFSQFKTGLPKKLQRGKEAKEMYDKIREAAGITEDMSLDEVLNMQQRLKKKQMMRRLKGKIKLGRRRAKYRIANTEKLKKRSQKKARELIRARIAGSQGKNYKDLPYAGRQQVDKRVEKKKDLIQRLAKRMMPKVKKAEMERVKKARSSKKEETELNLYQIIEHLIDKVNIEQITEKVERNLLKKSEKHCISFEELRQRYIDAKAEWVIEDTELTADEYAFDKLNHELAEDDKPNKTGDDAKGYKRPTEDGAGLTRKGAKAHGVKTAVTTPPSKLDPKGEAAGRRKSFCARSRGWTGERGKAARRRWNC